MRKSGDGSIDIVLRLASPRTELRAAAGGVRRARLEKLAFRWAHVVRNRSRWSGSPSAEARVRERAASDLESLGFTEDQLRQIAEAGHVEISIPYASAGGDWAACIFPWEVVIAAATKRARGGRGVFVTRHLNRSGSARTTSSAGRVLFVESAPGKLSEHYSFSSERRLILSSLEAKDQKDLKNPSLEELEQLVRRFQPRIIHFTGVDLHEGAQLLDDADSPRDGLFLRGSKDQAIPVDSEAIASALTAASFKPMLVTFTAHNSGARTAAMAVAEGAGAAIGFQDYFDNAMVETFYATFYRAFVHSGFRLATALRVAWEEMRRGPTTLAHSGVVVWSANSLVHERSSHSRPAEQVTKRLQDERERSTSPRATVSEVLAIDLEPERELNYSVLHNDQPLFRTFVARKLAHGRLDNLDVEVALFVGNDKYPFRGCFAVTEPNLDLNKVVRIPLTWDLARSIVESVRTTLFVEVRLADNLVRRETFPVILHPPNEWCDNERDGPWLPSFVLPRDPAVEQIVASARRALCAITDDPLAAFDGYQGVDPGLEDPSLCVDYQVQALWAALAFERTIAYINPPPSYRPSTQRLRTPTDVLCGSAGTCIDLALLLAACLEYVEIHPVLFLLDDHAFVGYWRSEESAEEFVQMDRVFDSSSPSAETTSKVESRSYVIRASNFEEILGYVEDEALVPLEATELAFRGSFATAIEEGQKNLRDRKRFHSLIDVRRARVVDNVTPLPLRGATRDWEQST